MNNKRTEDLLEQLKLENISYEKYLKENQDSFIEKDLSAYWSDLIIKCNIKKIDIINRADIGYAYFYDIIKGRKLPSRDTICRLCIAMATGVDTCQATLKLYNWAALYPKVKRDSIVIYALAHKLTLYQTEEMLGEQNEKSLIS